MNGKAKRHLATALVGVAFVLVGVLLRFTGEVTMEGIGTLAAGIGAVLVVVALIALAVSLTRSEKSSA